MTTANPVFDYTLKNSQTANSQLRQFDGTPGSELSYSYSEMIGELEGSNYQSQKMKMSSYLKHPTLGQSIQ